MRSLATLLDHLGVAGVDGERLFAEVERRFGPALEARGEEGEMDYAELVREALVALDLGVEREPLIEALRAGHREWDGNVSGASGSRRCCSVACGSEGWRSAWCRTRSIPAS